MSSTPQAMQTRLQRLAALLKDRTTANKQLAVKLEGEVLRNFKTEGAEFGQPWEPLKPSTIASRLRKGAGRKRSQKAKIAAASGKTTLQILQDTGHLRASFAGFSDNDQAGVGAQSNADHADLALVHQYGSVSRNIPARPMLPPVEMALGWAIDIYQRNIDQTRAAVQL